MKQNNIPYDFNWISHQSLRPDNTQPIGMKQVVHQYHNLTNGVPDDFDWIAYRSLNADLSHIVCYKDAIKHYKNHGFRQNRPYKFVSQPIIPIVTNEKNICDSKWLEYNFSKPESNLNQLKDLHKATYLYMNKNNNLPDDFDWLVYRSLNNDLTQIKSYQDAVKHYKEHGYRESRSYSHKDNTITESNDNFDKTILNFDPIIIDNEKLVSPNINENFTKNEPNKSISDLNKSISDLNKPISNLNEPISNLNEPISDLKKPISNLNKPIANLNEPISNLNKSIPNLNQDIFDVNKSISNLNQDISDVNKSIPNLTEPIPNLTKLIPNLTKPLFNLNEPGFDPNKSISNLNKPIFNSDKCISDLNKPICNLNEPISNLNEPFSDPNENVSKLNEINSAKNQISDLIPYEFDWISYKTLNPDLKHINSLRDAIKHYQDHGKRENRQYKNPQVNTSTTIDNLQKMQTDYDWITFKPYKNLSTNIEFNKSNFGKIPHDFDWLAYKALNLDLCHIKNKNDAIKHYREHGHRESRPYNYNNEINKSEIKSPDNNLKIFDEIPIDFNWLEYRSLHSDLKNITNPQELIKHYCEHGKKEGRSYKNNSSLSFKSKQLNKRELIPILSEKQTRMAVQVNQMTKPTNQPIFNPVSQITKPRNQPIFSPISQITKPRNQPIFSSVNQMTKPHNSGILSDNRKIISTNRPTNGLIPNIIHFIYGFKKQTEEFELFKYIAIKSANDVNRPEKIYFYYKYEPFGKWWNLIKPYLTMEYVEPPLEIFGNELKHFAHQSDVVRLKILNERGGIYLDLDTICLRPLKEFMKYDFVMAIQGDNYGLCNAIMMAKPNTEFGKQWFQAYQSFKRSEWDHHSVILPLRLSKQYPITILANDTFFYPLWDPIGKILLNNKLDPKEYNKIFTNSYCIHLWESWSLKDLKKINEKSIFQYHSLYNIIGRKFVKNTFSVVMLTYNRSQKTIECIKTFYKIIEREDIEEFIILDNNSNETKLLKFLAKLPNINKKFKIIYSKTNLGVCGGRLILFKEAKGSIIASVDSDLSLINQNFFDIAKELLYDESIGMIGSSGAYFSKSFKFNSHTDVLDSAKNVEIDSLAGCCQIFRNDIKYLSVELDTNYGKFWVEDADFSFQIRKTGKKLLLVPQKNMVDHTWGGSGRDFTGLFEKNWEYFTKKWKQFDYLCSI